MIRYAVILYFFCAFFCGTALCLEEIEIDSQVMSVNPNGEYIIIKAGQNDGVEIGDGLIVHRSGEKIAEAQVIEVRPSVAAAEILNAKQDIKEGDSILIVKKTESHPAKKREYTPQEQKKSKWTTLLGSSSPMRSLAPVETVASGSITTIETSRQGPVSVTQGASIVRADMDADASTVFSYSLMVLRENGYSVISSSRGTGVILATKPIELSLMKELWADATAAIEHKLVISLEMREDSSSTELNISAFKEHIQKNRQVKFPVARESVYYNDLVGLASKIKERSGR